VEVVPLQPQEAEEQAGSSGKRKAAGGREEAEEGRHAVLAYVVQELKEELFVELMQGWPTARVEG
jgi:hypothetical protein